MIYDVLQKLSFSRNPEVFFYDLKQNISLSQVQINASLFFMTNKSNYKM